MARILVVDDHAHIVELVQLYLENEHHTVLTASDGAVALETARAQAPDLMVLDVMLPSMDGFEVCQRLRREGSELPIIMLTARDDDIDKIVGLEIGADDYMVKPFNPRELLARIKAVLRRTSEQHPEPTTLELGDIALDSAARRALVAGKEIKLRHKEFDLLDALMSAANRVLTRQQLLEQVWGYEFYGDTRTVDVHIARLRDKLKGSTLAIETVWGVGYKLVTP